MDASSPHVPGAPRRLGVIALLACAVALGVALLWYVVSGGAFFKWPGASANVHAVAAIGFFPMSAIRELKNGTFSDIVVDGIPDNQFVTDMVRGAGVTYYLAFNPDALVSSIYAVPDGGPIALVPSSHTVKYDLAYDADAKMLVYLSGTLASPKEILAKTDWKVTKFAPDSRTETAFSAEGMRLALVPHAHTAYVNSKGSLVAVDLATGQMRAVLSAGPFAVNEPGTELAAVNPTTHAVDLFDLSKGPTAPSYRLSKSVPSTPTALAYLGGTLYGASGAGASLMFYALGGPAETVASPRPSDLMSVQRLLKPL